MAKTTTLKLSKRQAEVLENLASGGMITIDSINLAYLGEASLSPQTRYFLTEKRLVTRKDKEKAVTTSGNGYVITPKGLKVLSERKEK